jgi:RNase P protein component
MWSRGLRAAARPAAGVAGKVAREGLRVVGKQLGGLLTRQRRRPREKLLRRAGGSDRTTSEWGRLLGTLGKARAKRAGGVSDWRVEFTVSTDGGNGGSAVRRSLARRTVRRLYRRVPRRLSVSLHTRAMGEAVQAWHGR